MIEFDDKKYFDFDKWVNKHHPQIMASYDEYSWDDEGKFMEVKDYHYQSLRSWIRNNDRYKLYGDPSLDWILYVFDKETKEIYKTNHRLSGNDVLKQIT